MTALVVEIAATQTIIEPDAEEWRPIPGWDDLYSVSSLGRVRRDFGGRGPRA